MNAITHAYAVIVETRWFVKVGKGGRVLTAWSLAGATLYQGNEHGWSQCIRDVERIKKMTGRTTTPVMVALLPSGAPVGVKSDGD